MRRLLLLALAVALAACPPPSPVLDSGLEPDAGGLPTPCDAPEACHVLGVPGVCRQSLCRADVPCGDDLECGLGERCLSGHCAFTGCTQSSDCPTGKCLADTFSCVECGANADCPRERPVCDTASNTCVQCTGDAQCSEPGPGHCSPAGACVHCTQNEHCPSGLTCAGNLCVGVPLGAPCPIGTACAAGLVCVDLNSVATCLQSCDLYQPQCPGMQLCYKLSYSGSASLVFESQGPIGVCFDPQQGARGLRDACSRSPTGSNCQPNLMCLPDSASVALCRGFCDPNASGTCPSPEVCTGFVGDYSGRRYGLCLPDNGFGAACARDSQCRTGLSCQAYDDPSASFDLSPLCQFNVGAQPALAPCAPRALADGGVVSADRACQSGSCRADPVSGGAAQYFCYGACQHDSDCDVGPRHGFCDADFAFTTPYGTTGTLKGCRPACTSDAACGEYDAGVACRVRLVSGATPLLKSTCSPPAGVRRGGEDCATGSDCRSGSCRSEDGRGVARGGQCVERCGAAVDCAAAVAAPVPVDCLPTVLLGSRGPDGVAQTNDDQFVTAMTCSGAACVTDSDCAGDGGVGRCVPDVDPSAPGQGQVVMRCALPTAGVKLAGEACAADQECVTGVCGTLQAPSTGTGKTCFQACTGATPCAGTTTCRVGAIRVALAGGPATVDSCAP